MKLSKRVAQLKPSPTLALAAAAQKLKSEGKDVISLSVGEPDWPTFKAAQKAGIAAIKNGQHRYTPSSGTPDLRQAILNHTQKDLALEYVMENVTVSTGAKYIIFSALSCLLDEGDEVLIPSPYWVSYPSMVELVGAQPVVVATDAASNFKLTPKLLESKITSQTKILLLNSPSNPTGEVYSLEELKSLAAVLLKHPEIVVISDDIYNGLVFKNEIAPHILQAEPRLKDRTILINGVSKTYAMTGWRIGWALGPKLVITAMNRLQSQSVSCPSSISQAAAVGALEKGELEVKKSLKTLIKRRNFCVQSLNNLSGIHCNKPQGAFYIWVDISHYLNSTHQPSGVVIKSSRDFCEQLLSHHLVTCVPGIEFGAEGYIRLSYAVDIKVITEAVKRVDIFLKNLKAKK